MRNEMIYGIFSIICSFVMLPPAEYLAVIEERLPSGILQYRLSLRRRYPSFGGDIECMKELLQRKAIEVEPAFVKEGLTPLFGEAFPLCVVRDVIEQGDDVLSFTFWLTTNEETVAALMDELLTGGGTI